MQRESSGPIVQGFAMRFILVSLTVLLHISNATNFTPTTTITATTELSRREILLNKWLTQIVHKYYRETNTSIHISDAQLIEFYQRAKENLTDIHNILFVYLYMLKYMDTPKNKDLFYPYEAALLNNGQSLNETIEFEVHFMNNLHVKTLVEFPLNYARPKLDRYKMKVLDRRIENETNRSFKKKLVNFRHWLRDGEFIPEKKCCPLRKRVWIPGMFVLTIIAVLIGGYVYLLLNGSENPTNEKGNIATVWPTQSAIVSVTKQRSADIDTLLALGIGITVLVVVVLLVLVYTRRRNGSSVRTRMAPRLNRMRHRRLGNSRFNQNQMPRPRQTRQVSRSVPSIMSKSPASVYSSQQVFPTQASRNASVRPGQMVASRRESRSPPMVRSRPVQGSELFPPSSSNPAVVPAQTSKTK